MPFAHRGYLIPESRIAFLGEPRRTYELVGHSAESGHHYDRGFGARNNDFPDFEYAFGRAYRSAAELENLHYVFV